MAKYRCKNCNHVFETDLENKVCGNCGEKNNLQEEKSVDDLIKDI